MESKYTKIRTQVTSYMARVYCPDDGTELKADSLVYATAPPQYPHNCPECGKRVVLSEQYPRIEYS